MPTYITVSIDENLVPFPVRKTPLEKRQNCRLLSKPEVEGLCGAGALARESRVSTFPCPSRIAVRWVHDNRSTSADAR